MASQKIERHLYNHKIHILHDPLAKGSQPRYKLLDGAGKIISKPSGATTILGKVLAKDFVGWALDSFEKELLAIGPNITVEQIAHAKLASTRKRDAGANTGTLAHALVEQFLKEGYADTSDSSEEAHRAYSAFVKWFNDVKPEVIGVEEVVYSVQYGYAGAYDAMIRWNGKVYLTDLKTANASRKAPKGVYSEYFIQLGAYAGAYEEERKVSKNGPKIDGLMVISAKKDGKLDIVTNDDVGVSLDDCVTMFRKVCNLNTYLNYVTNKLGGK